MCAKNVVRRFGAFLSALVLCFSLTVPALADDFSGVATFSVCAPSSAGGGPLVNSTSLSLPVVSSDVLPYTYPINLKEFYVTSKDTVFSGSVGIYLSYVPINSTPSVGLDFSYTDGFYDVSSYSCSARSLTTGIKERHDLSLTTFTPSMSIYADAGVKGFSFVGRIDASDVPVYWPSIHSVWDSAGSPLETFTYGNNGNNGFNIVSARIVTTAYSAELDGLENIADSIVAQTEILSAYYGDIVAICNQIYQRLGDMQQTQIEANALLSSLVSLLDTTNGKISALNQAMSTYFELVLKSLQNESLSIQDCINDAELRLETYLKPIVDYFTELEETTGESASSLPGHKTDLDKWSSDSAGIDADAQTGLAAILPVLTAFSFIFRILSIFIGLGILGVIIRKGLS